LDREHDFRLSASSTDPRIEDLERLGAELLHGLADRGQRRAQVARHGHVVETGDGDVLRHPYPALGERVHRADGGLVAGANDGSRQSRAGVQERGDHVGSARCAVVALPGRSDLDVSARCG
jgi:hypothetical protein